MAVVRIRIETPLGAIDCELYPDQAPATVANFLRYVDNRRFVGGTFYRTVLPDNQPASPVKIQVIQGGSDPKKGEYAPILLERTRDTGLRHVDGALSMARTEPDTATSAFFFCIGDQPELDYGGRRNPDGQGFAAFGRITAGADVARKIQRSPHREQALTPAIPIRRIVRI